LRMQKPLGLFVLVVLSPNEAKVTVYVACIFVQT
jgi:hypothetical protein